MTPACRSANTFVVFPPPNDLRFAPGEVGSRCGVVGALRSAPEREISGSDKGSITLPSSASARAWPVNRSMEEQGQKSNHE